MDIYKTNEKYNIYRGTGWLAVPDGRKGDFMDKFKMEEKELKEKIEFCSLLIKYGKLVNSTSEQSIRAFKLKESFEEELRVLKLRMEQ